MLPEGWLVVVLGCWSFSLTLLIAAYQAAGRSWRCCLVGMQEAGFSGGRGRSPSASLGCPYPPGEQQAELEPWLHMIFGTPWQPIAPAAHCSPCGVIFLRELSLSVGSERSGPCCYCPGVRPCRLAFLSLVASASATTLRRCRWVFVCRLGAVRGGLG